MLCAIDTETGGLSPLTCSMLTLSIIPLTDKFDPDPNIPTLTLKTYNRNLNVEKPALEINKLWDFKTFPNYEDAGILFLKYLTENKIKTIEPLGHEIAFDLGFIEPFTGNLFREYFNTRITRCTRRIAQFLKDCNLYNGKLNLTDLCSAFDVPLVNAHNSQADALASAQLYKTMISRFKN